MADNRTTVKVTADASGYTAELDRARKSAQQFQQTQDQTADRIRTAQNAIAEAATNGSNASARAINSFVSQLQRTAATAGQTQAQILQLKAAQLGVTDSVSGYISAIQQASEHTHQFSLNTTASRRELMVLAHEASQGSWKRFGGSLMVLAETMDLTRLIMSPLGVSIGVAAGAAFLFAEAIYKGHEQAEAFNKAIAATGGYLGLSNEQLVAMSNGLGKTYADLTQSREALAQVAATGAFTADNLQLATQAALAMSSDIGVGTDKAAESLSKIQDGVLKWVEEYQKAHHTFNAAQIEEIDNFVKLGDTASATGVILRGLVGAHEAIESDADKHMGSVMRWWNDWANIIARVKNAIMNIGVPDGITKQVGDQLAVVEATQRNINDQRRMGNLMAATAAERQLAVEQKKLDVLRNQQAEEFKAQKAKEAAAKSGDAKVAVDSYLRSDKYASSGQKHTNELTAENEAFAKATKGLEKNSADYQAALKRHYDNVAKIDEDYAKSQHKRSKLPSENGLNGAIAEQATEIAKREAARKDALTQAKADFDTGRLQYEEYYKQVHDINAKAYDEEVVLAERRVQIATQKRELAARQTAQKELDAIVAARKKVETDYTNALDELAAKRQRTVEKYRTQQQAVLQKNADAYRGQDATRFMDSYSAADYNAQAKLYENYLQERAKLKEEYDSKKTDLNTYQEKQEVADQAYAAELNQLQDHLQREQALRENFSAQMGLQLVQLSGNGQTAAQTMAQGFSTVWSTANSALESFVTTGKFSFSSFASSVMSDLAKIALKMAEMSIFKSVATSFGYSGSLPGFADGGHIIGAGTGTSDSIPAMLSNGEFVVNAASTKKYRSLLEAINSGQAQHFATGGAVGSGSGGGGGSVTNLNLSLSGNGGGLTQEDLAYLAPLFQQLIDKRMAQNFRGQGGYGYQLKYGQV